MDSRVENEKEIGSLSSPGFQAVKVWGKVVPLGWKHGRVVGWILPKENEVFDKPFVAYRSQGSLF
jgi:hypothetical protein